MREIPEIVFIPSTEFHFIRSIFLQSFSEIVFLRKVEMAIAEDILNAGKVGLIFTENAFTSDGNELHCFYFVDLLVHDFAYIFGDCDQSQIMSGFQSIDPQNSIATLHILLFEKRLDSQSELVRLPINLKMSGSGLVFNYDRVIHNVDKMVSFLD